MNLQEISNRYFKQFVNNPKRLDLFCMYRNIEKLIANIEKQAELDNQQENNLTM